MFLLRSQSYIDFLCSANLLQEKSFAVKSAIQKSYFLWAMCGNKLKELNYFLNKTKQKNQALVVKQRIMLFRLSVKDQTGREI